MIDILNNYHYLLPFLLTSNNFYYYPVCYVIYIVAKYIYDKYIKLLFAKYKIVVYAQNYTSRSLAYENRMYIYISIFLQNEKIGLKIKEYDCYLSRSKKSYLDKYADFYDNPDELPDHTLSASPNQNIDINLRKIGIDTTDKIINLSSSSYHLDKINYLFYTISSNEKSSIDKFMTFVKKYAINHIKNMDNDSNKIKYFKFNSKENKWNNKTISNIKTFDNLFIEDDILNIIKKSVECLNNDHIYKKIGLPQKTGLAFYGEPGCGKTSTIYAIASEYKLDIYELNMDLNEEIFEFSVQSIPEKSIVCINDIDIYKFTNTRSNDKSDNDTISVSNKKSIINNHENKLKCILDMFDGYCYLEKCIIIITTNYIDKLDTALIRPGRINHKLEFKLANRKQIREILSKCANINIDTETLNNIPEYVISVAEIINSYIMPNLTNPELIIQNLVNHPNSLKI